MQRNQKAQKIEVLNSEDNSNRNTILGISGTQRKAKNKWAKNRRSQGATDGTKSRMVRGKSFKTKRQPAVFSSELKRWTWRLRRSPTNFKSSFSNIVKTPNCECWRNKWVIKKSVKSQNLFQGPHVGKPQAREWRPDGHCRYFKQPCKDQI